MSRSHILFIIVLFIFKGQVGYTQKTSSWQDTKTNKQGLIEVHWKTITPYIYSKNNLLQGIEYDIADGFRTYLKKEYNIALQLEWVEKESFFDVMDGVKKSKKAGIIGASSISITEERRDYVGFSPPYMPDVSIIVTNKNVPMVKSLEEFKKKFGKLKAITAKGSTFEAQLFALKASLDIDFDIEYVSTSDKIIEVLVARENTFGYVELANYLHKLDYKNYVKRQSFFPIIHRGYGFIFPPESDWNVPLKEYFDSSEFALLSLKSIIKHLDSDIVEVMERIVSADTIDYQGEIMLLNKEKEIQREELYNSNIGIQRQIFLRNLFLIGLLLFLIIAIFIYSRFKTKEKANVRLSEKQNEIEKQRKSIKNKNNQLAKRNKQLVDVNNMIGILSHDLRAPISQIKGLASLYSLENKPLSNGQHEIINKIISKSDRLSSMISQMLNLEAIEADSLRVKMNSVNLSAILLDVVDNFRDLAENKKLSLTTVIQDESYIFGDKLYLTQVYENLISNAIKFTEPGKNINVELNDFSKKVQTIVSDQGPGLTNDDKGKLFQKFQKLTPKPTGGEDSIGLGLSIVKKYVDSMQGKIWCESEPGKGSAFITEFGKKLKKQV